MKKTNILLSFAILAIIFVSKSYAEVKIMSDQERALNSEFVRLPGWERLEFVKPDGANLLLIDQYFSTKMKSYIQTEDFNWLQIRDFDIYKPEIRQEENTLVFPFVLGIRYQKIKNIIDGTINVAGEVRVTILDDNYVEVTVTGFKDNEFLQVIGRTIWFGGPLNLDKNTNEFVQAFVKSALTRYFSNNEMIQNLMSVTGDNHLIMD